MVARRAQPSASYSRGKKFSIIQISLLGVPAVYAISEPVGLIASGLMGLPVPP